MNAPLETPSETASAPENRRSLWQWLKSHDPRPAARTVVDLDDPVGSAIKDAEVLMAFAAQSAHVMDEKNLTALTTAIALLNAKRRTGQVATADELTQFWIAYDVLGNSMAPLSALSIRSSMRLNAKRFPESLATATGMNAMFAIAVFLACILLQGFWGAGRELLDKAEALEAQKTDLQLRIQRSDGVLTRRQSQIDDLNLRLCPPGSCPDDVARFDRPPDPRSKSASAANAQISNEEMAKLRAEKQLAMAELREMRIVGRELLDEQLAQTERSRAVEAVIESWYNQTNLWCEQRLLKILCPIKQGTGATSPRLLQAQARLGALEKELSVLKERSDETARGRLEALQVGEPLSRTAPRPGKKSPSRPAATHESIDEDQAQIEWEVMQKERQVWEQELEINYLEAESLRAVLLNVRLTLANIANYLIPMLMGLLGALAFILRSLTIQLREHTYVHMSASLSVVRMCLGAVAGVFGTLLAPVGDGALKGLPPLIIPFVFGYGIEILFSIMDRVVGSFTQTDGPKAGGKAHV